MNLVKRLSEVEIRGGIETIYTALLKSASKSPEDLKKFVVTQTSMKNNQLELVWKIAKYNDNNNNNKGHEPHIYILGRVSK